MAMMIMIIKCQQCAELMAALEHLCWGLVRSPLPSGQSRWKEGLGLG